MGLWPGLAFVGFKHSENVDWDRQKKPQKADLKKPPLCPKSLLPKKRGKKSEWTEVCFVSVLGLLERFSYKSMLPPFFFFLEAETEGLI